MAQPASKRKDPSLPFHIMLTTYELILNDVDFLSRFRWRTLIIDEAHRLKNASSALYTTLRTRFIVGWKLLLTGTPAQNDVRELYALLSFANPDVFHDEAQFLRHFNRLSHNDITNTERKQLLSALHRIMAPIMLRRLKEEVALGIPPKKEVVMYTGLSAIQKNVYKSLLTKNVSALAAAGSGSNSSSSSAAKKNSRSLVNIISSLRRCCAHPYLFDGIEPEPFTEGEHIIQASGKFVVLDALLRVLKKGGHRVLLFSTSVQALDVVQDFLSYRSYTYERLDGSVRGEERYVAIDRFSAKDSDTFVFLLSTRAGGTGLNLTMADTVIFLDSDWNPQADLQAQARVHRIGQTKPVTVIRLCTANTIEEIIQQRTAQKLQLTSGILARGKFAGKKEQEQQPQDQDVISDDTSYMDLHNILTYGLDRLWQQPDVVELGDEDIESMLAGASVKESGITSSLDESDVDMHIEKKNNDAEMKSDSEWGMEDHDEQTSKPPMLQTKSMYHYEGIDYKHYVPPRDPTEKSTAGAAWLSTLIAEQTRSRTSHEDDSDAHRSDTITPTRKRKHVDETPEARAERLARSKQRKLEAAQAAEQKRAEKLKALWKQHQYVSLAVQLEEKEKDKDKEEDGEDQAVEIIGDDDDDDASAHIHYVVGDVTKTFQFDEDGDEHIVTDIDTDTKSTSQPSTFSSGVLIVNCVDDSGAWGHGHLFRSLASLSHVVSESYEMAGKMRDLHLGDVHLIPLHTEDESTDGTSVDSKDGETPRTHGAVYVAHVIAQHRDRAGRVSAIKEDALKTALCKIQQVAASLSLSVHMPRIGAGHAGFSWYPIERLIQRYLAKRHVPTYVYYYKRRRPDHRSPALKVTRLDSTSSSSSSSSVPSTHSPPSSAANLWGLASNTQHGSTIHHTNTSNHNDTAAATQTTPIGIHTDADTSTSTSTSTSASTELPDFLSGTCFLLDRLSPAQQRTCKRYAIAYGGDVAREPSKAVTHILSTKHEAPDETLLSLSSACHPSVRLVDPDFVDACVRAGRLLT